MNPFENEIQNVGGSSHLNNMGGPSSRARTEKISSSLFDHPGMNMTREVLFLDVPMWEDDLEAWYLSIARKLKWKSWEEAMSYLKLPSGRWLVLPAVDSRRPSRTLLVSKLRTAVILSKCSKSHYSPDSPMIFTRSRLEREIEMVRINLNGYYEMD